MKNNNTSKKVSSKAKTTNRKQMRQSAKLITKKTPKKVSSKVKTINRKRTRVSAKLITKNSSKKVASKVKTINRKKIRQSAKLITEMSAKEARAFLLKNSSYCSSLLPSYFNFTDLLNKIKNKLQVNPITFNSKNIRAQFTNHTILTNKNGSYAWRALELIHPALYVNLVLKITETAHWRILLNRLNNLSANPKIICASIPVESNHSDIKDNAEIITRWWQKVEQESISKALDFKYLLSLDIDNCYPSIYTHSISWAIHGKKAAKSKQGRNNKSLLGNIIDYSLMDMSIGQTNGIPQGSVLMDFIAEILLAYGDHLLGNKLTKKGVTDYHIIRYRDDYKIFSNSKENIDLIARELTTVLQDLGLKLNSSKTQLSEDIVLDSIKPDKREAMSLFGKRLTGTTIQKKLLKLLIFSRKFPNSGMLNKYLSVLNNSLKNKVKLNEDLYPIVSIIAEIMFSNPITYSTGVLVLSNILKFAKTKDEQLELLNKIKEKFKSVLGTGFLDIWLQRISYFIDPKIEYNEKLCKIVTAHNDNRKRKDVQLDIWNSDWISDQNFRETIMTTSFIDKIKMKECTAVIPAKEVILYEY